MRNRDLKLGSEKTLESKRILIYLIKSRYRNDDFKRSREGDTDGSNSDVSDDNSEKGSSHKRPKKIFAGNMDDGRNPQESMISSNSKGVPSAIYYPPEAYPRIPDPNYGYQRPVYLRDNSQIPPRREHSTNPMENMQRHSYPMNIQPYPMMYFRYPYDPYAPRHCDPSMMVRPYGSVYPAMQGYYMRKLSNNSDTTSLAADASSPATKLENESSDLKEASNSKLSQDSAKNINTLPSQISDPISLRSFYEPSSGSKKSKVIGASSHEYGHSNGYYYPHGSYGYPSGGDASYEKRSYVYPSQYPYPPPVNQAMFGMPPINAPPIGYYAHHYHGMYPTGPYPQQGVPYPQQGVAQYQNSGQASLSVGSNNHGKDTPPSGWGVPSGYTYPGYSAYSPELHMYAHGAPPSNYQAVGPVNQKRNSLSSAPAQDSRSNSTNSLPSAPAQDSRSNSIAHSGSNGTPPPQNMTLVPSSSNGGAISERQRLYSRPPYPQFVTSQDSVINLPPLNLSNPKNGMPQNHENVSSASLSPVVEPKREPVEPSSRVELSRD